MNRIAAFSLAVLCTLLVNRVEADNDGMISSAAVESVGLTVQWFNQVDVGFTGEVVDIQLNVNEDRATTYFATTYGSARTVISQHHLDAFGNVMGIDGTEEYVNLRKEILEKELAAAGRKVEVNIEKYTLPKSTIYTITSAGVVTSIDADSGQILWTAEVGSRELPSWGLGASHDYVAAVNGSSVYCLDAETGKQLWARPCGGAVSASPAVNENYVYVPMIDGHVKIFPLNDEGRGNSRFVAVGQCYARPLITSKTVSWPTSRGHYYVANNLADSKMMYQLKTEKPIVSSGSYMNGQLFVGSLDGFIYSLEEANGALNWEFSTGDNVSQSPIPLDEFVFVITDEGEMFKINSVSGLSAPGWDKPLQGISGFVGASEKNIYLQNKFGTILIVNQQTGRRFGQIDTNSTDLVLENRITDRLYVGNKNGLIQCLREIGSPRAKFHKGDLKMDQTDDKDKPAVEEPQKPAVQQSDDPFKKIGDDPFKKNDAGAGGNDDPFKTGGGSGGGASDDPFKTGGGGGGASDDPFGSGGG